MTDRIRLVLADDQAIVRGGYRLICQAAPEIEIVGEASDGHEAIALVDQLQPDVVVMDVRMPGMDGLTATERIVAKYGDASPRVVVLTTFENDEYVYGALRAGATSFLLKDTTPEEVIRAIQLASIGEVALSPSIIKRLLNRHVKASMFESSDEVLAMLTEREVEVFQYVAKGLSNTEIAGRLFIAERTVKGHVSAIFAKLSLTSRAQAVVYAYEHGLVQRWSSDT